MTSQDPYEPTEGPDRIADAAAGRLEAERRSGGPKETGASSLLENAEREARAWEWVARAVRDLTDLSDIGTLEREILRTFVEVTQMTRGTFLRGAVSGRLELRTTVGDWSEGEGVGIEEVCARWLERVPHGASIDWIRKTGGHPVFPPRDRVSARAASAALIMLSVGEADSSVIYLDSAEIRGRPSAGELRALEFLAAETAACLGRGGIREAVSHELERTRSENTRLRYELEERSDIDALVGACPDISEVRARLARMSGSTAPVLITGEGGTGKSLVARILHTVGPLSSGPIVTVHCDAFDRESLGGVLFGDRQAGGRLEAAAGGTLFLDEVGELPLQIQAELEDSLTRLGEPSGDRVPSYPPFRLMAASRRDLADATRGGRFRSGLFSRLSAVTLLLPPLHDRSGDISLLASRFVREFADRHGKRLRGISTAAKARLLSYTWPGNVRQLRDVLERAVALSGDEEELQPDELGLESLSHLPTGGSLKTQLRVVERELIQRDLRKHGWNISRTAKILSVSRQHLHNLVRKHGLSRQRD